MPSFDIVSEIDHHELTNSVDQTTREIANRFDFKGTSSKIEQSDTNVVIYGDNDCLLYTSPSPRDISGSRMPSSA